MRDEKTSSFTSTSFHKILYVSGSQKIELFPTMHYRSSIDFRDATLNPFFEFSFGFHSDLPEKSVRHLAKKRFDQIQPGTVLGRVDVTKAVRPCCQIGARFLGDVSRMIIQNNPNGHPRRIISIQVFEQRHKLPAAMSLLDSRHHVPVVQVQRSQDRKGPVPFV